MYEHIDIMSNFIESDVMPTINQAENMLDSQILVNLMAQQKVRKSRRTFARNEIKNSQRFIFLHKFLDARSNEF